MGINTDGGDQGKGYWFIQMREDGGYIYIGWGGDGETWMDFIDIRR